MFKSLKEAEKWLDSNGCSQFSGRLWSLRTPTPKYAVPYRYGRNCWYIRFLLPFQNASDDDDTIKNKTHKLLTAELI